MIASSTDLRHPKDGPSDRAAGGLTGVLHALCAALFPPRPTPPQPRPQPTYVPAAWPHELVEPGPQDPE